MLPRSIVHPSFVSTLFLAVCSSAKPTNPSITSEADGITWISPKSDHAYHPGDVIHLQWFVGEDTRPPNSFSLCVEDGGRSEPGGTQLPYDASGGSAVEGETAAGLDGQLESAVSNVTRRSGNSTICGDRIWAKPLQNSSVYSIAFIAPNVTSPHMFFLQSYYGHDFVGVTPSFSLRNDVNELYRSSSKLSKAAIVAIVVPSALFLAIALLACISTIRDRRAAAKAAREAKNPNKSLIVLDDPFLRTKPAHLPTIDREPPSIAPRFTSGIRQWRSSFVSHEERSKADVEEALPSRPCDADPYPTTSERAERRSSRWSARWSAFYPPTRHSSKSFPEDASRHSTAYVESCGSSTLASPASLTAQVRTVDRARMQLPRLVVPPTLRPVPPPIHIFGAVDADTMASYSCTSSANVQEPALPTPVALSPARSLPLPPRPRAHPHALTASARLVPGIPLDPVMVRIAESESLHMRVETSPTKPADLYARVQQALTSPHSPLQRR